MTLPGSALFNAAKAADRPHSKMPPNRPVRGISGLHRLAQFEDAPCGLDKLVACTMLLIGHEHNAADCWPNWDVCRGALKNGLHKRIPYLDVSKVPFAYKAMVAKAIEDDTEELMSKENMANVSPAAVALSHWLRRVMSEAMVEAPPLNAPPADQPAVTCAWCGQRMAFEAVQSHLQFCGSGQSGLPAAMAAGGVEKAVEKAMRQKRRMGKLSFASTSSLSTAAAFEGAEATAAANPAAGSDVAFDGSLAEGSVIPIPGKAKAGHESIHPSPDENSAMWLHQWPKRVRGRWLPESIQRAASGASAARVARLQ